MQDANDVITMVTQNRWIILHCDVLLEKVKTTFVCRRCLGSMKDDLIEKSVIIGKGVELEKVRKFCYLGDMLDADGGVDSAVTNRIRCAWNKFRELAPFLTAKRVSLQVKGKCMRAALGAA
jgi:hypothetical protein